MHHRLTLFFLAALLLAGCMNDAPPPARVPAPAASNREQVRERDYIKPLPAEGSAPLAPEPAAQLRPDDQPVPPPTPQTPPKD